MRYFDWFDWEYPQSALAFIFIGRRSRTPLQVGLYKNFQNKTKQTGPVRSVALNYQNWLLTAVFIFRHYDSWIFPTHPTIVAFQTIGVAGSEIFTRGSGTGVDSQIWHLPRPTCLTGRVDRLDRSGLYSPSKIRFFFVKSPHVILLVKGTSSPAYKYKG